MSPDDVIKWLNECSKDGPRNCEQCPYNKEPYEAGCGKLLSDAALLLTAAYKGTTVDTFTITPDGGMEVKYI